jgi:hypothetical protein
MENLRISETDYVRLVLAAYRQTPTTIGRVHPPDRLSAAELYNRGIPVDVVENALVLGAVRRLYRNLSDPPLRPVRSLYYFRGLIDEVLDLKAQPKTKGAYFQYFQYLRFKIKTFDQAKLRFQSQKT